MKQVKLLLTALVLLCVIIIAGQNASELVTIRFLFWNLQNIPVLVLIGVFFIIGCFTTVILKLLSMNKKETHS